MFYYIIVWCSNDIVIFINGIWKLILWILKFYVFKLKLNIFGFFVFFIYSGNRCIFFYIKKWFILRKEKKIMMDDWSNMYFVKEKIVLFDMYIVVWYRVLIKLWGILVVDV